MSRTRLRRHPLGFLEATDRPDAAELAEYYAQQYYQRENGAYSQSYSESELAAVRRRTRLYASRVSALRGGDAAGTLLDIGCGEGFVLAEYLRRGWSIRGIDYSRAGVAAIHPELTDYVDQGDIYDLLREGINGDKRYDLLWLGHALEHVLDPIGLLQQIRRLATEDSILVVTVPNDGSAYHSALEEAGAVEEGFFVALPDHLSYFTAESLRRCAEATGWQMSDLLADFPIDLFLAHEGSNYRKDSTRGPAAHQARLLIEEVVSRSGEPASGDFYAALAAVGLGRNVTAFLKAAPVPKTASDDQGSSGISP
jgi:2-polyprenyl-3-methyl-5-hydroxy-6-metoxy-1,4-benzoquinol methylase